MGEPGLAKSLSKAEDVLDEDPSTWASFAPPPAEELGRMRKKLFILIGSMGEPFPAAG
jgi:hypothetical protein